MVHNVYRCHGDISTSPSVTDITCFLRNSVWAGLVIIWYYKIRHYNCQKLPSLKVLLLVQAYICSHISCVAKLSDGKRLWQGKYENDKW